MLYSIDREQTTQTNKGNENMKTQKMIRLELDRRFNSVVRHKNGSWSAIVRRKRIVVALSDDDACARYNF